MTGSEKLVLCKGCSNDFYNGNNPYGIECCWYLEQAKPVKRKFVHINARPPWNTQRVEKTLSCYRRRKHTSVDPEVNK